MRPVSMVVSMLLLIVLATGCGKEGKIRAIADRHEADFRACEQIDKQGQEALGKSAAAMRAGKWSEAQEHNTDAQRQLEAFQACTQNFGRLIGAECRTAGITDGELVAKVLGVWVDEHKTPPPNR